MKTVKAIFEDIKIEHTLFALPFAVMSAFIAANGWPGWRLLALVAIAMFFVRSAAMAFNRFVDEPFDRGNPRTNKRALPDGRAQKVHYLAFITACGVGFIITCGYINILALQLSPVALFIVFFYSYTKRFTHLSHFFLGLALALAPVGAWVAVREEISVVSLLLGVAVIFWLAGLDTIYSCQDYAFDKESGLQSIPQRYGVKKALKLASYFHVVMVALLVAAGFTGGLSYLYGAGVVFTAGLLWYEHSLVRPDDLSRLNMAFFNVNGLISVGLALFTALDTSIL